jgi:hypothetical protein
MRLDVGLDPAGCGIAVDRCAGNIGRGIFGNRAVEDPLRQSNTLGKAHRRIGRRCQHNLVGERLIALPVHRGIGEVDRQAENSRISAKMMAIVPFWSTEKPTTARLSNMTRSNSIKGLVRVYYGKGKLI